MPAEQQAIEGYDGWWGYATHAFKCMIKEFGFSVVGDENPLQIYFLAFSHLSQ